MQQTLGDGAAQWTWEYTYQKLSDLDKTRGSWTNEDPSEDSLISRAPETTAEPPAALEMAVESTMSIASASNAHVAKPKPKVKASTITVNLITPNNKQILKAKKDGTVVLVDKATPNLPQDKVKFVGELVDFNPKQAVVKLSTVAGKVVDFDKGKLSVLDGNQHVSFDFRKNNFHNHTLIANKGKYTAELRYDAPTASVQIRLKSMKNSEYVSNTSPNPTDNANEGWFIVSAI